MSQKSDEKRRIFMGLAKRKFRTGKGIREKKQKETSKNNTKNEQKKDGRAFRFKNETAFLLVMIMFYILPFQTTHF